MSWTGWLGKPMSGFLARRKQEEIVRRNEPKPPVGGTIYCAQFRITVQAGMSMKLWRWLSGQGWRTLASNVDRYRYRAIPSNVVSALCDAVDDQQWERILASGMRQAVGASRTSAEAAPARA